MPKACQRMAFEIVVVEKEVLDEPEIYIIYRRIMPAEL